MCPGIVCQMERFQFQTWFVLASLNGRNIAASCLEICRSPSGNGVM